MVDVGIIGAMALEIEQLEKQMKDPKKETVSGVEFTRGQLCGKEVVLAVCGIGKCFAAMCAEAMFLSYRPRLIVNIGVAGTLTPELGIGDIAVGTDAVCHDMDTTPLGDPPGYISGIGKVHIPLLGEDLAKKAMRICRKHGINAKCGTIASGDQFIVDPAYKTGLRERYGAIACEMEGQPIAQVCYMNRLPCLILRSISDSFEGGAADYETFKFAAAETADRIVAELLAALG